MGKYDRYKWATPPAPIPENEIKETVTTDAVIVGAGFAGCAAALSAREQGLEVIQIEKSRRISHRGFHIAAANSRALRAKGIVNDIDEIEAEWIKVTGSRAKEEIIRLYLEKSEEAMNWLLDKSEAVGNSPTIFAGGYKGTSYKEFVCTHLFRGGTDFVVNLLHKESVEKGVEVHFNTSAVQLVKENGRVTGVIAQSKDGTYTRYMARKGVVLATGDIGGNREMCEDLAPQALTANGNINQHAPLETGDGIRMGIWAGGTVQEPPFPCTIHPMAYSMYCFFFLMVNQKGKRYMNEDAWAQGKSTYTIKQDPEHPWGFAIFDSKWEQEVTDTINQGGGMFWDFAARDMDTPFDSVFASSAVESYVEEELVGWKTDTLEELAEKIGVPWDTFKATVDRYNELVAKGHDDDFGKKQAFMTSISKPPYYALKVGGSLLVVSGGLSIDKNLNVVDEKQEPIPGLYAIGNTAGDLYAIDYPLIMAGNSHGRCLTFGYLVGKTLAQQ